MQQVVVDDVVGDSRRKCYQQSRLFALNKGLEVTTVTTSHLVSVTVPGKILGPP